ncbi:beta-lactamase family protein [Maribacter sp.]|nr:beta-lactamase family protein [Maribacter sp.]
MNTKSLAILMLILSTFLLNAQELKINKLSKEERLKIDAFLSATYAKEITGAAVLASRNGKVIYENYSGLSDVQHERPVKHSTKFNIGSITKQFTATAILLLQEQGKLKVSDYLGEHMEMFTKEQYPIKIEHLLTHTSGIHSKKLIQASETGVSKVDSNSFELLFTPGEKYEYSNNGYILLGLLIEKISGLPYKDFIGKHIFIPLKMTSSTFTNDNEAIKQKALGYYHDENGKAELVDEYVSTFSAGDIVSTPRDMNKWVTGLFNHKLINRSSLSAMLKDYQLNNGEKINYGYGWELNEVQNLHSYEHSGGTPGFKANSIYIPDEKQYIIVMQNTEIGSPTYPSIQIASMLIKNPYPLASEALILSRTALEKFIGTYALENGDERYIGYNDATGLYYKRLGGQERTLYVRDKRTLSFAEGYVNFNFSEDSDMGYKRFEYKNRRSPRSVGFKTTTAVPKKNEIVQVELNELKNKVGNYVFEQFTMMISLESGVLFAQPKGSDKEELTPKGNNQFFIEALGAEIEFTNDGEKHYLNLILEGNAMNGVRE